MKIEDIKIGAKVKCTLLTRMESFGKVGTICKIEDDPRGSGGDLSGKKFQVNDDAGNPIGSPPSYNWFSHNSFELISPAKQKQVPMNFDNCKVGARVICVFDNESKDKLGTIKEVLSSGEDYMVEIDGGFGTAIWGYYSSWDILIDDVEVVGDIVVDSVQVVYPDKTIQTTCPRKYYGLPECTCGSCPAIKSNPHFLKIT